MTWSEAVDEALCFGWIDGVRRRLDDESYTTRTKRLETLIEDSANGQAIRPLKRPPVR
jgi:hypothetical protein